MLVRIVVSVDVLVLCVPSSGEALVQRRADLVANDPDVRKQLADPDAPLYVKTVDKVTFILGVLNLVFLAIFAFGAHQSLIFPFTLLKFATLIPLRFVMYREQRYGYFLLDFCYFANLVLFVYVWAPLEDVAAAGEAVFGVPVSSQDLEVGSDHFLFRPTHFGLEYSSFLQDGLSGGTSSNLSAEQSLVTRIRRSSVCRRCFFAQCRVILQVALFKAVFLCTAGPLIVAVFLFRNTLVFHSIDKMTSCFIHVSPLINMFVIRWGFMEKNGPQSTSTKNTSHGDRAIMVSPSLSSAQAAQLPDYFQARFVDAEASWTNYNLFRGAPFMFTIPRSLCLADLKFVVILWLVHQILYVFLINVVLPLPADASYLTTYRYLMDQKKGAEIFKKLFKPCCGVGENPACYPVLFFFCNFVFIVVVAAPGIWIYNEESGYLMLVWFFAFAISAIRNGASFYTDVFALKYASEVKRRAETTRGALKG